MVAGRNCRLSVLGVLQVTPTLRVKYGMQDAKLTIEIKNKQPIELVDLTKSFLSLADEFKRFIENNDPEASEAEVKLYVGEIRSGSVVADLVAISPFVVQGMSYLNTVISFNKHLRVAYEYLSGHTDEKPELEKATYQNLATLVEPIAKDTGAQLNISAPNGNVYITIGSIDANAAQNKARKEIENLREPVSALHEKVVLYWYQARGDVMSQTGDKAIIESLSPKPKKIICANDTIKAQMIFDTENPFKWAYVVDVVVETIGNKPVAYKILAVHEKFERSEVA